MKSLYRWLTFLMGAALTLLGAYLLANFSSPGFVGGYVSEVERALHPLNLALSWLTIACGFAMATTSVFRSVNLGLILLGSFIYALLLVGRIQYEAYLRMFLDYGQGG